MLFGAAQLGAVFVPMNTRLAPPEIAARPCGLGRPHAHPRSGVRRAARSSRSAVANRTVIVTGEGIRRALRDWPRLLADWSIWARRRRRHPGRPRGDHLHLGHDRSAKGAVLTHRNLTWVALNCLVDYDVVSTDVALMISPMFHVASLGMGALPDHPQGRDARAREGLRSRPGAELDRSGTASRCSAECRRPTSCSPTIRRGRRPTCRRSQKLTCGGLRGARHASSTRTRSADCRSRRATG